MGELKAYWCTPKDYGESSDVVFAESRSKAISIALSRGESCNGCAFLEVRAIRCKKADEYADTPNELYKPSVWRQIGGCSDLYEPRCDCCNLATMDNEYPLCESCGRCSDCAGELTESPVNKYDLFCLECGQE